MFVLTYYYFPFDEGKNKPSEQQSIPISCPPNHIETDVRIIEKQNYSDIYHPDDLLPLYQNKGGGLTIPSYNLVVKKSARSENDERIMKVKEYCQKFMPSKQYLRLANEYIEETNKFLYYDFYYAFLYCQTQKVRGLILIISYF